MVEFFNIDAYFHAQILAFHYKKSKMKLISFFLLVNWQLKSLSCHCSFIAGGSWRNRMRVPSLWLHTPYSHLFPQIPDDKGAGLQMGAQKVHLEALLSICFPLRLCTFSSSHVDTDINGSMQGGKCFCLLMGLFPGEISEFPGKLFKCEKCALDCA